MKARYRLVSVEPPEEWDGWWNSVEPPEEWGESGWWNCYLVVKPSTCWPNETLHYVGWCHVRGFQLLNKPANVRPLY